uniref:Uncharacterized protein n=1 Tax=Cajanus cajan TaxID=3821 RepID=A0A151U3K3_CAJCA|nr:hypothetical protein KK1_006464 [Cajanus cajan]
MKHKERRKDNIFFKLDYEKAYDLVIWKYLFYMLQRLGFSNRWIKWIEEYLKIAHVSLLVNRSPMKEFKLQMDLRQGD